MIPARRPTALTILAGLMAGLVLAPGAARADVPSLQVAPLQFEATLTPGRVFNGYIDVANPSDSDITITTSVRGFRQVGQQGDLEFYDDPDLSAAIKPGLNTFGLGPREAVRVVFSVDAGKLPQGGTYAAVFFRTVPPEQSSRTSFVSESANIGTLLMLTNGSGAPHRGRIAGLRVPFWQFGAGLAGSLSYANTDTAVRPVGFKPQLGVRVTPWGRRTATPTGLVLPGATRDFRFTRPGAYLGLLPVTLTDADSGASATTWVLACTGWFRWFVPLALLGLLAATIMARRSGLRLPRLGRLRLRPHSR